jgi:hypothetical protein
MFKCQVSGKNSKPREKGVKIVTKTRPKLYFGERLNRETKKMEVVQIGEGHEIVQEKLVLKEIAALHGQEQNT